MEIESIAALARAKQETGRGIYTVVGTAQAGETLQDGREVCSEGREITTNPPLFHNQGRSCPTVLALHLLLKNFN